MPRSVVRHPLLIAGLLALAAPALPAVAANPLQAVTKAVQAPAGETATPAAGSLSLAALQERLADTQAELSRLESGGVRAANAPKGIADEELHAYHRALRLLAFSYRQRISVAIGLDEQRRAGEAAAARRKAWSGFAEPPPYSILMVDALRSELQGSVLELRGVESRMQILGVQEGNARTNLTKAGERARLAQEAAEAAAGKEKPQADWRLKLAQLDEQALASYLSSLDANRELTELRLGEARQATEFVRRKIAEAEKSVAFGAGDLAALRERIDEQRNALLKSLDEAAAARERAAKEVAAAGARRDAAKRDVARLEEQLAEANRALAAARHELAQAEQADGVLQKINPFRGRAQRAALDKQQAQVAALDRELAVARVAVGARERDAELAAARSANAVGRSETTNVVLATLDIRQSFWDLRFAASTGSAGGAADLRQMYEGSRNLLQTVNPLVEHLRAQFERALGAAAEQQNLQRAAPDAAEAAFRQAMAELLAEREQIYLQGFGQVEGLRQLLLRWVEESEASARELGAGGRAQQWLERLGSGLVTLWRYELFTVEDTIEVDGRKITGVRGVTVAKLAQGVMILLLGYVLIALATRRLLAVAERRLQIDPTQIRIARKWILAVALVALLLIAMAMVKIPLTAFAFLGGAIAIGAGFGMQTLLKNLISGVMLLLERPFRPRDIVEVAGIRGEVTDINVRSCTIRDVNGIETLVPNSTFLEQNVTNWTLSSRLVRYTLRIGVAYGSPVRRVAELLREVAAQHAAVLREPPPEVLFEDFADNALIFSLSVWLDIGPRQVASRIVLSDLRFMIDEVFAENGIAIPFPQRDVHLDAASPLPVRVVGADGGG